MLDNRVPCRKADAWAFLFFLAFFFVCYNHLVVAHRHFIDILENQDVHYKMVHRVHSLKKSEGKNVSQGIFSEFDVPLERRVAACQFLYLHSSLVRPA